MSINTLNKELELIDKMFTANKLTLSSNKSKFMFFHSRQRQFPTDVNEVMINKLIVERVTTMKFPGVQLDGNLTGKTHLPSVSKKLYIFLPSIKKKVLSMLQL